ncbi:hypothetical protein K438DRAFT_2141627 [Mycena galopus ATCC 62051]|nr:hypothetical protein K438DRAFT_2141627 [Mycena galopus ATCC 62051]
MCQNYLALVSSPHGRRLGMARLISAAQEDAAEEGVVAKTKRLLSPDLPDFAEGISHGGRRVTSGVDKFCTRPEGANLLDLNDEQVVSSGGQTCAAREQSKNSLRLTKAYEIAAGGKIAVAREEFSKVVFCVFNDKFDVDFIAHKDNGIKPFGSRSESFGEDVFMRSGPYLEGLRLGSSCVAGTDTRRGDGCVVSPRRKKVVGLESPGRYPLPRRRERESEAEDDETRERKKKGTRKRIVPDIPPFCDLYACARTPTPTPDRRLPGRKTRREYDLDLQA